MRMLSAISAVICLVQPAVAVEAGLWGGSYYCVEEISGGLAYDEVNKRWESSTYHSVSQDSFRTDAEESPITDNADRLLSLPGDRSKRLFIFYQVGFWVLLFVCLLESLPLLLHSHFSGEGHSLVKSPVPSGVYLEYHSEGTGN